MFKLILTVKRRAGLSFEEFRTYYRTRHLPFLAATLPHTDRAATAFRQNFVKRDDAFLTCIGDDRADANPPFDCISELEFERREDAEAVMRTVFQPQYFEKIKQDESNFVDLRSIHYYVVEAPKV